MRARFPLSHEAAPAGFALGRLSLGRGQPAEGCRWFEQYLAEQPHGPLSSTALVRLLEIQAAGGDQAAAQAVARAYLRDYPTGLHAALARRLLERPGLP